MKVYIFWAILRVVHEEGAEECGEGESKLMATVSEAPTAVIAQSLALVLTS